MILEMDVGNSLTKWRLLDAAGNVATRGQYPSGGSLPPAGTGAGRVRIACVAGDAERQRLTGEVIRCAGVPAEFAQAVRSAGGVTSSYPDPARMGVDRWLALLAAWHIRQERVIVVDAGTAITVDALGDDGVHRGGYIMPGTALLHRALRQQTQEVRPDPQWQPPATLSPGRNTDDAVGRGVCLMAVAAIEAAVRAGQAAVHGDCRVLLCGGDAGIMRSHLPGDWLHVPDLVLDGLAIALP